MTAHRKVQKLNVNTEQKQIMNFIKRIGYLVKKKLTLSLKNKVYLITISNNVKNKTCLDPQ